MKPFNLERALAGDPVQTMDGRPVTQLTRFECKCRNVVGVVEGELYLWDEEGHCGAIYDPNKVTLVMAPVKKTGWMNLYEWDDGRRGGLLYLSEEEAKEDTEIFYTHKRFISTIKMEWEE